MRIVKLLVAAVIPFALLGCPDSAKPDPAATADGGTPAAVTPKAGATGSVAVPAKDGSGW